MQDRGDGDTLDRLELTDDAHGQLRRLTGALREALPMPTETIFVRIGPFSEVVNDESEGRLSVTWSLESPLEEIIEAMDRTLADAGFNGRPPPLDPGEVWSLGSLEVAAEARPIYRGFLEPVLRIPRVARVPDRVVAYLILLDEGDGLGREHHDQFGWHYHYLDRRRKRSDTILCWDPRWTPPIPPKPGAVRPLFWELHAERNADFEAHAHEWRGRKRASMHAACAPDLREWKIETFKPPGDDALAVWPETSVLTPRPPPPPPKGPSHPAKPKWNRRR